MTTIEQTVSLCVRSTEPHAIHKAAYLPYNFFTEVGQLIRGQGLEGFWNTGRGPLNTGSSRSPVFGTDSGLLSRERL
jgi:hypothetical protein